MPWFKIDDSAYSHPKFIRAGNAALGLWLRCGAYSAQHLLEGAVPGAIAKSFGSPAQVRKLIAADLWHGIKHDCPRCPQPADGDYVIHDFFEGGRNSTRAQVEASRQTAADRQARARARAAERATSEDAAGKTNGNRGQNSESFAEDFVENFEQSSHHFSQSAAGQDGLSQRDAIDGVTPSQAKPYLTTAGRQAEQPVPINGVRIPDWAQPLIDALARRGISVSWARLSSGQWFAVQQLINTRGVDALAGIAASRWNPRDPIKFASLLLTIWLEHPMPSRGNQAANDSPPVPKPPHCGDPDCDKVTRTRQVEDDNGIRTLVRCQQCHPHRKEPAA